LLSPSGEQLKQGRKVAAAKIKNGDTLTFVIISRDPRAEDWIARATWLEMENRCGKKMDKFY